MNVNLKYMKTFEEKTSELNISDVRDSYTMTELKEQYPSIYGSFERIIKDINNAEINWNDGDKIKKLLINALS